MRKQLITAETRNSAANRNWLDLARLARAQITSEVPAFPIEAALTPDSGSAWRAAATGEQIIRLLFDVPLRLRRIRLVFDEGQNARTQEFVLRWSPDVEQPYRDIVRQQYTFSPPSTSREVEDFNVDLEGVSALELRIIPSISGDDVHASLTRWQLA
jgi:hypothetical protein